MPLTHRGYTRWMRQDLDPDFREVGATPTLWFAGTAMMGPGYGNPEEISRAKIVLTPPDQLPKYVTLQHAKDICDKFVQDLYDLNEAFRGASPATTEI